MIILKESVINKPHTTSNSSGFTLVETMVVAVIILLIVGGGIASFVNFNDKQQVVNSVKEIQGHLRMAQTLSRVGETPSGCGKLYGYIVRSVDIGPDKQIKLIADCESGEIERNSFDLITGTTLGSNIEITFLTLHGGVSGAGQVEVVNNSGRTYQFGVNAGGEITQGEFL
ncbi:prepilin-type N-terminal cleavage/methylation domain-containing protein [Patescibacteria group bacterium]|nr:prepilin-type N-terminal cleavage/methylation domain-containing protein [Patescibacteria group bacterium]MBU1967194.1 prepilin-type N-terminal cleavage/methylation domain-containing protein [Patescibacteria group bacterium]MBU2543014.1 prepilin-type N-terminal cleavage/methylation domain-containing protein [Patescibacteria group bacterium]